MHFNVTGTRNLQDQKMTDQISELHGKWNIKSFACFYASSSPAIWSCIFQSPRYPVQRIESVQGIARDC